jgi:16S rRNA (guanine527-N7)-methyltransferase
LSSNKPDQIHLIEEACEILDIRFRNEYLHAFSSYLALLKKWSCTYSLTAIKDDRGIIIKHFIDSLSYVKAIPDTAVTLADIGTGAGFPGVPLKIVRPNLRVYLIEPSRKKTSFLRSLIRELSLHDIFVLRCRVEEYPCDQEDSPGQFDVVVTRALYKTDEFIKESSHLCKDTGTMIISKGPAADEEIKKVKGNRSTVIRPDLSSFGIDRYLVTIKP